MVCIFDAPRPKAAERIDGGTAFKAARVAMMIVGSVINVSTRPPTTAAERGHAGEVDEDRQAEQTIDDGGNRREVVDIDLDQIGQPVLRRKLLQIDRCRNADRKGKRQDDQHHVQRAECGDADAGGFRTAGGTISEQAGVELLGHCAGFGQLFHPFELLILHLAVGFGNGQVDLALVGAVDIAFCEQRDIGGRADDGRIGNHQIAQLRAGTGRNHVRCLLDERPVGRIDAKCLDQRVTHQKRIVRRHQLGRIGATLILRIDDLVPKTRSAG